MAIDRSYRPTRVQIRRVCLRIQSGWSRAERERRRLQSHFLDAHYGDDLVEPLTIPEVSLRDLGIRGTDQVLALD